MSDMPSPSSQQTIKRLKLDCDELCLRSTSSDSGISSDNCTVPEFRIIDPLSAVPRPFTIESKKVDGLDFWWKNSTRTRRLSNDSLVSNDSITKEIQQNLTQQ